MFTTHLAYLKRHGFPSAFFSYGPEGTSTKGDVGDWGNAGNLDTQNREGWQGVSRAMNGTSRNSITQEARQQNPVGTLVVQSERAPVSFASHGQSRVHDGQIEQIGLASLSREDDDAGRLRGDGPLGRGETIEASTPVSLASHRLASPVQKGQKRRRARLG